MKKSLGKLMGGKLLILTPVVLLVAFLLYFLLSYTFEPELNIKSLKLTNVTDTSVTVTWVTDKPTTGYVVMADNNNFDVLRNLKRIKFGDDREVTKDRYTHHVTVSGLTPESTYYFNVVGSLKSATYKYPVVTTAKTLDALKTPDISYAELATGSDDYIVYAELPGSQMVSVPLAANNTFTLDKALIRTSALDTFVTYKDKDIVSGEVVGGTNSSTYLYQVGSDAPAKINLDFKAKVSLNRSLVGSVSAANSLCQQYGLNVVWDYPSTSCASGKANFKCFPDLNTIVPLECVPVNAATPAPAPSGAPTGGVSVAPTGAPVTGSQSLCDKAFVDGNNGLEVSDDVIKSCAGNVTYTACNSENKSYVQGGRFNGFWVNCTSVAAGLSNNSGAPAAPANQAVCDRLYNDGAVLKLPLDDATIRSCVAQEGGKMGNCISGKSYASGTRFNGFWASCSATDPNSGACKENGAPGNYISIAANPAKPDELTSVCVSDAICNAKAGSKTGFEMDPARPGSCRSVNGFGDLGKNCPKANGDTGTWVNVGGTLTCYSKLDCVQDSGAVIQKPDSTSATGCSQDLSVAANSACDAKVASVGIVKGIVNDGKCIVQTGATCTRADEDSSYVYNSSATPAGCVSKAGPCSVKLNGRVLTGTSTGSGCSGTTDICNARVINSIWNGSACVGATLVNDQACGIDTVYGSGWYGRKITAAGVATRECLNSNKCSSYPSYVWNDSDKTCREVVNTSSLIGKACELKTPATTSAPIHPEIITMSVYYDKGGVATCRFTQAHCVQIGPRWQLDTLNNKCIEDTSIVGITASPKCETAQGKGEIVASLNEAEYPQKCISDAICVAKNGAGYKMKSDKSGCELPAQLKTQGADCEVASKDAKSKVKGTWYITKANGTNPASEVCSSANICKDQNGGGNWKVVVDGNGVPSCQSIITPSGRLSSNLTNVVDAQASVLGVADASGVTTVKVSENGIYKVEGNGVTTKEIKVTTVKDGVAEIKFFNDVNSNGVQDTGEELITDPVSVKLEKTSDVVKYDLTVGWNLVAFNFVQSSFKKANELVNEITSQGGVAITVATYRNGKWLSFVQRSGIVLGDNFDIVPGEGYFIRVTKPTTLDVGGTLVQENSNVYLSTGWNLLGIRTSADKKASDVLDALNKNAGVSADIVTRYVASKYENVVKDGTTLFGEDFKMESNRGYFIRAKQAGKVVTL